MKKVPISCIITDKMIEKNPIIEKSPAGLEDLEIDFNSADRTLAQPVPVFERPVAPEIFTEKPAAATVDRARLVQSEKLLKEKKSASRPPAVTPLINSLVYQQVEGILEDGLADIYQNLPAAEKTEFKRAGEQATFKITVLLGAAKLKLNKIFDIIVRWLKIIPSVNRYFLEQEAKIKADRILSLRKNKN